MKKELLIGICLLVAIMAGCLSNPVTSNSSAGVHEVNTSRTTAIPPTQNQKNLTAITVTATVSPHFSRTISIGANKFTIGSNQSPPITEDQAWKYAEQYLAKYRMQGFNQAEIIPRGQGKKTFENGTQTWTWGFRVNRCAGGGCYGLAVVIIDANDGELIILVPLD